jgi:hypothetical protein
MAPHLNYESLDITYVWYAPRRLDASIRMLAVAKDATMMSLMLTDHAEFVWRRRSLSSCKLVGMAPLQHPPHFVVNSHWQLCQWLSAPKKSIQVSSAL